MTHSRNWVDFPTECLWYFVPMGVVHLAAIAVGSLVFAAVTHWQPGTFRHRAGRFSLFVALLLLVGSLFNGLWSCSVWGWLYYSPDSVFDFTPFWPITESVIDRSFGTERGQLLGITLIQLQLVWLLFALGTWVITALLYRTVQQVVHFSHTNERQ